MFGRTILPLGITPLTTHPAPITQLSPISAPLSITALEAIQQLFPILIDPIYSSLIAPYSLLKR